MNQAQKIVGRYAPSPTGDLHLGNLRTALLSWLQVRLQDGCFLVRIEDIDTPRVVKGSASKILNDLEWLGLDWDGEVVYQSSRLDLYKDSLNTLNRKELVYPCFCSRKDIQLASNAPDGIYNGLCRNLTLEERHQRERHKQPAIRIRVGADLVTSCGDFVVRRADNLFAYQLVVVVDDLDQGVTDVLRGQDLLDSTPRQQYLAKVLKPDLAPINYLHSPLMYDSHGKKMSKRDGSLSIAEYKNKGYSEHKLVGELAFSLGLVDNPAPISTRQLLKNLTASKVLLIFN